MPSIGGFICIRYSGFLAQRKILYWEEEEAEGEEEEEKRDSILIYRAFHTNLTQMIESAGLTIFILKKRIGIDSA